MSEPKSEKPKKKGRPRKKMAAPKDNSADLPAAYPGVLPDRDLKKNLGCG